MNRKKYIMKRKILVPIISVFILILLTLVISILNSGTNIANIFDSYFPVWIFLLVIISHNGITYYAIEEDSENATVSSFKHKFKKVSGVILFFLLIQILMSFSSLWRIISISRIISVLMILFSFVVLGEIVCIGMLYSSLRKILYSGVDAITYRKINKKTSLYILMYFAIYFIFTLIVALDYYLVAIL